MKGKTILVTGASEGIGRATAIEFAKKGCHLILAARNGVRLKELKNELAPYKVEVTTAAIDLSDEKALNDFFTKIPAFDIAINNAGVEGAMGEIQDLTVKDYNHVFDLNVRALFQCMIKEVSHFRSDKKPGAIVNVASVAGIMGIAKSSIYVASKHAVIGFTKAVAVEQVNYGIRVNSISPGATDTPMIHRIMNESKTQFAGVEPSRRMATPEEMAQIMIWLCAPESRHIIGQNIVVDAGKTVRLS